MAQPQQEPAQGETGADTSETETETQELAYSQQRLTCFGQKRQILNKLAYLWQRLTHLEPTHLRQKLALLTGKKVPDNF